MPIKRLLILMLVAIFIAGIWADNKNTGDNHPSVVKNDSTWTKNDTGNQRVTPDIQNIASGVSYYTNQDGIFIMLSKATTNIKLFALTGDIVWQGNLVQGRFFIPVRPGIYFLRVNNKSYKVICK
ncbi:MAG: hypothetical protein PHH37_11085 [Paludibacter sp.]|nr:hypothetical protein [Paludibacter sp.]